MSVKHITLKINSAKETVETYPITSQQGQAVIVQAQPNVRYQLIDEATQFGPENIMAKRVGQDLQISFEGTQVEQPDLIIQDYYATNNNIGYSNGQANMLIGQHESGSFYPYVPESAQAGDAISMLAEQITAGQALGGEHLVTALWLPLSPIGANWLFWGSMLALGAGGLIAAVAGNNDSSPNTPPATIDNLVPTASNDSSAGHTLGQAVTVNVLANDSDADGSLVPGSVRLLDGNGQAQTSLTVPGEGVWSVNTATGAITFTPNADFTGDPTPVNYQVADNLGATARASVSVDYNQPPTVEVTLTITPKQGEAVAGQPVATSAGTDPEGKPVTYSLDDPDGFYAIDPNSGVVTLSERGAAHINNGEDLPAVKVIVTDDAGLTGSDDSNITPPATIDNLVPTASNDSSAGHILGQAVTVNVLANDSDADGSLVPGSVRLLDGNGQAQTSLTVPGEGVWSVNTATGAITFTPNADFTGDPTPVNYQVADNLGATARASVSVDYNQPPTVEVTLTITPKQGEAVAGQPVATSAGTDPEGKPITYSLDDPDGFYAIDPTTGVVTLSERGAAHINNGEDLPAVKVIVTDEAGLTGSDDSNITPPATIDNLVPTASNDSSAGHTLGQAVTVNVLANDSDADGSLVPGSVRLLDGNGQAQTSLTVPGEGVWSVNTATGAITFTPNADFTGDPTPVNYQVADNLGATARASVSVDYNQPPTVEVTLTITPKQGEAVAGQPVATSAGTDPEGKPITYSLDDPDGFYAIDPTTGVVTLSERGAAHINNGEDLPAVKVIVTDEAGLTGSDDSNITPPATIDNLVPTASNDSSAGHTLGQAVTVNVLANDSDADGSLVPGSVRLLDGNGQAQTSLTVPGEGVWSVNTATGAITFTPNADFTGDPTPVNYQVADNLGATARASVSVDYNQPPTVEVTLTITPKQGEAVAGQPVATSAGTDPEGKPITYSLDDPDGFYAIDPTTGVVTLSERGAAHINNGEDLPAVKVIVTDEAGLTGSDDSNITPPATIDNLVPTASNDSSAGHTLGQAVTVNVLANDSDADGSLVPGSVRLLDGNGQAQTSLTVPGEGVWSVNTATGAITFTPNADFTGDPTPVNYQVADNLGATARASVSVDYNQPPTVEVTLTITPKQGEAVAGQPVATSAGTDPEGKPITYSLDDPDGFYAIDPTTGVVTLSERGAAHINNGEDLPAVKVIVTDEAGLTGSDDSNITPPATIDNLVPTASNDSSAGHTLGQAVTVNVLANDSDADGSLVPGSVRLLDGNGQAQTSLTVPGEGVWSVNTATGAITFTPNADFTGDPTPVNYQVADNLGATARASVSVDYNQPPTVEVTLTITPKQGEAVAGQPVATSAGTDPEGKPITYSLDDPDGFYAIDPTTGVVTLSERGAAHINNGEDLPAVKVIVTDEAGLTGSDDSNITPPATAGNLQGVASFTAIDESHLGLNGEYYGYSDGLAYNADGSLKDGFFRHANDKYFGNLDGVSDMEGIINGRNAVNGAANNIVGTHTAAATNTPDARFKATKIDYGGVTNSLGHNPELASGSTTGMDENNSSLYKFLSLQGSTDAQSLVVEHGLGNTTDAGIRMTGYVYMEAGYYDFRVRSDDGFRLKIDGQTAVQFDGIRSDNWSDSVTSIDGGNTPHPDGFYVKGGLVAVELLYWEKGSKGELNFQYQEHGSNTWKTLDLTNTLMINDSALPALNDLQDMVREADVWSIRTGEVLDSGAGNDVIVGSAGRDYIMGGKDNDTLSGGDGNDTFIYSLTQDNGTDTITDFTVGKDKIVFSDVLSAHDLNPNTPAWLSPDNAQWDDAAKTLSFSGSENGVSYTNNVHFSNMSDSYATVAEFLAANGVV